MKPWERDWSQPEAPAEPAPGPKPWERDWKAEREARVQQQFADKPWYRKMGTAVRDVARLGARGALGMVGVNADELAASIRGTDPNAEKAESEDARIRGGLASDVAEIGGGMIPIMAAGAAGLTPTAMTQGAGLLARTGAAAVEGAGWGAADAYARRQDVKKGAAAGAVGGAAGTVLASGAERVVSKGAQAFKRFTDGTPKVPSTDELRAMGQAAYKKAEDAGVMFTRQGMDRLRKEVVDGLGAAYDPDISVPVKKLLKRLDKATPTLNELHNLRKLTYEWYDGKDPRGVTNKLLKSVRDKIDDFVMNADKGDVLMGDNQAAAAALKEARSLWQRQAKSGSFERALANAENAANPEAATRGAARTMLRRNQNRPFLNPDEVAAAEDLARGTMGRNLVTATGRAFSPTTTLGAISSIGGGIGSAAAGYPGALATPAVGYAAKGISDAVTSSKARRLAELMRMGSAPPKTVAEALAQKERDTLVRAITSGAIQEQDPAAASLVPYVTGRR